MLLRMADECDDEEEEKDQNKTEEGVKEHIKTEKGAESVASKFFNLVF